MSKRKYLYPSREAAEQAAQRSAKDASVLNLALNLVLNSEMPDYQDRAVCSLTTKVYDYTVKVYGVKRADGGIVIVTFAPNFQRPHSAAYYALDWTNETLGRPVLFDHELMAIRDMAERVRRFVYQAGKTP